jgi:Molecular chaperone GrpE (heat shock protein)
MVDENNPTTAPRRDNEAQPDAAVHEAAAANKASAQDKSLEQQPSAEEFALLLEDARRKAEAQWDEYLRARAELDNVRKRSHREVENARKYAVEKFALELLPVKDSLELGLAAVAEGKVDVDKLREGKELTLRILTQTMEKFGIRELNPHGEKFNPELHEAMALQETDSVAPHTVVNVIQKGYVLHDRLIRPAMVIISKAPEVAPDIQSGDEKLF